MSPRQDSVEQLTFPYRGVLATWEAERITLLPGMVKMDKPRGLCGKYIAMAELCTDAPWAYHEASFWTIIGTALGRTVFTTRGPQDLYPNMYVALLGKSTTTHKTTAINIAYDLANMLGVPFLPASVTPERLMQLLVEKPRGVLVAPEFSKFLSLAHKHYGQGLIEMLLELYDCPDEYATETKGEGRLSAQEPFVSVLAASTPETFKVGLTETDISGGLVPRFVLAARMMRRKLLRRQVKMSKSILKEIAHAVATVLRLESREVDLTEGAERENEALGGLLTRGFQASLGEAAVSMCERLKVTVLKIALMSSVLRDAEKIGELDIHAGAGLALRVLEGHEIIGPILQEVDKFGAQVQKIEDTIRNMKTVPWSMLQRRDRRNIPRARFTMIIKTLQDSGLVEVQEADSTGGRKTRFLVWTGPEETDEHEVG